MALAVLWTPAHAIISISEGSVVYDSSNELLEINATLFSNTDNETLNYLVIDPDGSASWDNLNASVVYSNPEWEPFANLSYPNEFSDGQFTSPLILNSGESINLRFILSGAVDAIGNQWQLSGGESGFTDQLNNQNLAFGVAGTVVVPELNAFALACGSLILGWVGFRRRHSS